MGERMDKRIRFYIYWILGFVLLGACAPGDKEDVYTEMRAFEDFSHITYKWRFCGHCAPKGKVEGFSKDGRGKG